MKKSTAFTITLIFNGLQVAQADYSSNGVVVNTSPDIALAATQQVTLNCAANQPVAKLIWHIDHLGWSGGDNVTRISYPASTVLAALGGGPKQDVTVRCSAVDENDVELANRDTTITVYDPATNVDPATGDPWLVVPKAMLNVQQAKSWDIASISSSVELVGTVDPKLLGNDQYWRPFEIAFAIGARLDGKPYNPRNNVTSCESSFMPRFDCVEFFGAKERRPSDIYLNSRPGTGWITASFADEFSSKKAVADFVTGVKVSRTLTMKPWAVTDLDPSDSRTNAHTGLGESYQVGATEFGTFVLTLKAAGSAPRNPKILPLDFAPATTERPAHPPELNGVDPVTIMGAGLTWGVEHKNCEPNSLFCIRAGEEASIPLIYIIGMGITGNEMDLSRYHALSVYPVQGSTTADTWLSGRTPSDSLHIKAHSPGRLVFYVAYKDIRETQHVGEHLITLLAN